MLKPSFYAALPWVPMLAAMTVPTLAADSLSDAIRTGESQLQLRLRSEWVDDPQKKEAVALTLRTRLQYQTDTYHNLSAQLEFDDTRAVLGQDDYAPVRQPYAVVADPQVTELNQAHLQYQFSPHAYARLGRQRVLLANQRHVGAVGWRQDDQTFDAGRLAFSNDSFSVDYVFIDQVNGILPKFDANSSHHLLHATYRGMETVALSTYGYRLKNNNEPERETYGIRATGNELLGELVLNYQLEFANQQFDGFDAAYGLAEAEFKFAPITIALGGEILGSDEGEYGFQTPLATKHAFNGWADQFLNTPEDGLQDLYLRGVAHWQGIKWVAVYHDFTGDHSGDGLGTELDLLAVKKLSDQLTVGVKYAQYREDGFKQGLDKGWVWVAVKF